MVVRRILSSIPEDRDEVVGIGRLDPRLRTHTGRGRLRRRRLGLLHPPQPLDHHLAFGPPLPRTSTPRWKPPRPEPDPIGDRDGNT